MNVNVQINNINQIICEVRWLSGAMSLMKGVMSGSWLALFTPIQEGPGSIPKGVKNYCYENVYGCPGPHQMSEAGHISCWGHSPHPGHEG